MMTLKQISSWIDGGKLYGDADTAVTRVNTDTRTLTAGDLFIAIQGEHFDGNLFLDQAKLMGARAAIAHSGLEAADLAGIEVADTKIALGQLAMGWRNQFSLPLVAVTGSNGKTTVTQMLASIFRAYQGDDAFATMGNLNNDIGVSQTLLRLNERHKIGVVELGMNHPGEIAYLATLTKPSVALVNNAQREHLEFMVSVEAVAYENGAVIESLPSDGIAVFPADDDYTPVWRKLALDRRTLTFALLGDADVYCLDAVWDDCHWHIQTKTPQGTLAYDLHIAGQHNLKNSLAAVACAYAAEVPPAFIVKGLQGFRPVAGRSNALTIRCYGREIVLIDDTYNANPDSMKAAIDVLAGLDGPRLLVIGDMGEVGEHGVRFHAEVGEYAKTKKIENLFTIGELAKEAAKRCAGSQHFENVESLNTAVMNQLAQVKSILVKGSRFMKMERVILAILNNSKAQEEPKNAT